MSEDIVNKLNSFGLMNEDKETLFDLANQLIQNKDYSPEEINSFNDNLNSIYERNLKDKEGKIKDSPYDANYCILGFLKSLGYNIKF